MGRNIITGSLSWEYRAYGSVPPGVQQEAVMGVVFANVSWLGSILPFVSGQNVIIHEVSVDQLKQQIDAQIAGKH